MKLPGIGEKTATRLAFYTLDMNKKDVEDFSHSLQDVKEKITKYLREKFTQKYGGSQSAEKTRILNGVRCMSAKIRTFAYGK